MHFFFHYSLLTAILVQCRHVEGMAVDPRVRYQEAISNLNRHFPSETDGICARHRNHRQAPLEAPTEVQNVVAGTEDDLEIVIQQHRHPPTEYAAHAEEADGETHPAFIKRAASSSEENGRLFTVLQKKMDSLESRDKNPKRSYSESSSHYKENRYDRPSNGNLQVFLGGASSSDDFMEPEGYAEQEWVYQGLGKEGANVYQDRRSGLYPSNGQEAPNYRSNVYPESRPRYSPSEYNPPEYKPPSPPKYSPPEYSPPQYSSPDFNPPKYSSPKLSPSDYSPPRHSSLEYSPSKYSSDYSRPEHSRPAHSRPEYSAKYDKNYRDSQPESYTEYRSQRYGQTYDAEEISDAYKPRKNSGYRKNDSDQERDEYKPCKKTGGRKYDEKGSDNYKQSKKSGYTKHDSAEDRGEYGPKKESDDYGMIKGKYSSQNNLGDDVLVKISVNNDKDSPDEGKVKIDVKKDKDLYPEDRELKISVKKSKDLLPAEERQIKVEVKTDSEQEENKDKVKISVKKGGNESGKAHAVVRVKPPRKCCKKRKCMRCKKRKY